MAKHENPQGDLTRADLFRFLQRSVRQSVLDQQERPCEDATVALAHELFTGDQMTPAVVGESVVIAADRRTYGYCFALFVTAGEPFASPTAKRSIAVVPCVYPRTAREVLIYASGTIEIAAEEPPDMTKFALASVWQVTFTTTRPLDTDDCIVAETIHLAPAHPDADN